MKTKIPLDSLTDFLLCKVHLPTWMPNLC